MMANSQKAQAGNSPTPTSREKERELAEAKLQTYPDLTFYYGITPREIAALPGEVKKAYIEALPRLIAAQQQRAIQAATFSNMKKADQNRIQRDLKRAMQKKHKPRPVEKKTVPDLEKSIHGVGIGLKKVGKRGKAKKT